MTREEARDILTNKSCVDCVDRCAYPLENQKGYCEYADAISMAIDALKDQRWIPVSEKLPEEGVYLVYAPDYQGGSLSAKEWHDGVMFSKYKNGKWSIEHGYYSRPNCVIAWMPLPKLYKGDENDAGSL